MHIGITYDLKTDYLNEGLGEEEMAEFDRPDTVDSIEGALNDMGYATDRIGNLRSLAARLAAGHRWDMVFNIAEGLYGYGRESAVPALLDSYRIPYTFSDPMTMGLTLHKGMAKHVMRSLGIPTPDFHLVRDPGDLDGFSLPFPVFAKPVAEGTSKGIDGSSRIQSMGQLRHRCGHLLTRYRQPVLVETYLPGREFTVGVVAEGYRPSRTMVLEITYRDPSHGGIYCYETKEYCENLVDYLPASGEIAGRCVDLAIRTWNGFGLRDAARIDLRLDGDGNPNVLEVNPLPGLNPEHSDLPIMWTKEGLPYGQLISEITGSCLGRNP
ncbi:MAG: D-alanine--D-alanine ligase [bacterium]|nr:MAG: D-alanine--D-alanine ligase [bacterium]